MIASIQQQPLTAGLKSLIYEGFAEAAIEVTGINGLADEPVVFQLSEAGLEKGLAPPKN